MAKIYQCGFSAFVYELFEDEGGSIRATKTAMRSGKLCLTKEFSDAQCGREWIVERNDLDQRFIMACKQLADRSGK